MQSVSNTATLAQWQAALQSVEYLNTSDTPNTTDRTFSFVVNDGGLNSTVATKVVSITAINDTPTFMLGDGKVTTAVGSYDDYGYSVIVQADGKILVAGSSNNGSNYDFALTRYNPDGSLDASFDGDGKVTTAVGLNYDTGYSIIVQADGKILLAGSSNNGSNYDFALTRYNPDGSLDTSFDNDGKVITAVGSYDDQGYSVTVQTDGKILVVGSSYDANWNSDFALTRYNPDGSLDTSFGADGKVTVAVGSGSDAGRSVTVQADGKILVAGTSYNGNWNGVFALTRYNADGSLDTSFDNDGKVTTAVGSYDDRGQSVTVQADGKILVAGFSYNANRNGDFALARYNPDGSLDTSFDGDGKVTTAVGLSSDAGQSVTMQADGKILVAGFSYDANWNADFVLTRYNSDGSLDVNFDGDGAVTTAVGASSDQGYSVTVQSDGKILVAGSSWNGGNQDFALIRYNSDGSLDTTFDSSNTFGGTVDITSRDSAMVAENTTGVVYQAVATDPDGDNITYSLSGADAGWFNIDEQGMVSFKNTPDYEAHRPPADGSDYIQIYPFIDNTYDINFVASDGTLSTEKAVTITVTDVNEVNEVLLGEPIYGTDNNDTFVGTSGIDYINGFSGDDVFIQSLSQDILTGGAGQDTFNFKLGWVQGEDGAIYVGFDQNSIDTITDFVSGVDTIGFEGSFILQGLSSYRITPDLLVQGPGAVALDANDYFIFDSNNGALYYDADGNGAGTAQQFATLNGVAMLTASDIMIYASDVIL